MTNNLSIKYQRAEALVIFISGTYIYFSLDYEWYWFVLLLLSVDIFMVGYLANNKLGAHIYNIGHSYAVPALTLVAGYLAQSSVFIGFSLIWICHIAMDRAVGYGLKESTSFHDTHLGHIQKPAKK